MNKAILVVMITTVLTGCDKASNIEIKDVNGSTFFINQKEQKAYLVEGAVIYPLKPEAHLILPTANMGKLNNKQKISKGRFETNIDIKFIGDKAYYKMNISPVIEYNNQEVVANYKDDLVALMDKRTSSDYIQIEMKDVDGFKLQSKRVLLTNSTKTVDSNGNVLSYMFEDNFLVGSDVQKNTSSLSFLWNF